MSSENKNIPPGDNDQDKLMDYLRGNMQDKDQNELERKAENDEFLSDAMEGLSQVKNKDEISAIVAQLNNDLKKNVQKKKNRKEKRKLKDQPYVYFAIIIILLLAVVAYLVINNIK